MSGIPVEISGRDKITESMRSLIAEHWFGQRSPNSPACDRLVKALAERHPGRIIEAPAGEECLTWIMPRRWVVREAHITAPDGCRLADASAHPMHLWWHSIPVRRRLSLVELQQHLFSDPQRPDWIPFHYRNGYRHDAEEWGFSLPHSLRSGLKEGEYEVLIDSSLDNSGSVKVLDFHLPGRSPDCILFAAHTCHSAQVTDGLSCVAALSELFSLLERVPRRRWSYRFVAGPEYYAAAAFLAKTPAAEVDRLRGGLYVDMLGNGEPLAMQASFAGESAVDRAARNVLLALDPQAKVLGYRKLWGNDETFYEGTGFRIPTPGLGGLPHERYHTSADNPENLDTDGLVRGLEVLLRIVRVLEDDAVIVPRFRGPLYLSRYGLYIDPKLDPKGYENLEAIQILMSERKSCLEIADELDIDFFFVRKFAADLAGLDLVELRFDDAMLTAG